jgi:hypothetical protein
MQILFLMFWLTAWDDFLEWFLSDPGVENGTFVASNWFTTAVMWAVVVVLIMTAIKGYSKYHWNKKDPQKVIWFPIDTWKLIGGGSALVIALMTVHWWASADFWFYIGSAGLAKGVVFALLMYLLGIVAVNFIYSPWRRELF